jgi:chromate transporter
VVGLQSVRSRKINRGKRTIEEPGLESEKPQHSVSLVEALWVWAKVAALSFGGPTGQIAVMHRILVEEKRWITDNRFLHALNYCMLLPGPEAQQLAIYVGWLLHRVKGGLIAGVLFVLPGFVSILALSVLYAGFRDAGFVEALLFGLKAAVVAVVIDAVIRIGKRALKNGVMVALAAAAFVAIFFFAVPFPLIIVAAGLIGYLGGKIWEEKFYVIRGRQPEDEESPEEQDAIITDSFSAEHTRPSTARAIRVATVCLSVWLLPLAVLAAVLGAGSVYVTEGLFFSKAAMVTFGGAYAVLSYIAQQAVQTYGWLQPGEMLDGLGMAETTPGPLIQVVQFVGFMAAFRNPGPLEPMLAGVLGSVVVTWVTFAPCFLWIFLGAPYIEYLRGNKSLSAALSGITAAVVGVVLNLAVWFALQVAFETVRERTFFGVLQLSVPDWQTVDVASVAISAAAFLAIFRLGAGMIKTLLAATVIGLLYHATLGG